jgi:hypothetical protein
MGTVSLLSRASEAGAVAVTDSVAVAVTDSVAVAVTDSATLGDRLGGG